MSQDTRGAGRFAPSPSGDLHVGNIRTGVLAFLCARQSGRLFRWRIEDLDRVQEGAADRQLADLEGCGVVIDPPVLVQSTRTEVYSRYLADLARAGLTYECYCSRREIQAAPSAPHHPPGAYPGTCRDLPESVRAAARERLATQGRSPAIRLRSALSAVTVTDDVLGEISGIVDDFVLRRGDGVFAYNLAVVVDDGESGIDQVVRADDLASSAPRQAYLARLLGFEPPRYVHVPLVLSPSGSRLAKRDGAVTLSDLAPFGFDLWDWLGRSCGFGPWTGMEQALAEFSLPRLHRGPVVFTPPDGVDSA
ncbi:tRNA glutamyl-Q(34) synthetase GluQRS [Brevibacterium daeguense]|uniref:tRNA glutamyl-Q(34) synthetase GluQRS n=1 Tax=Brevibacterium daeguense TaxID=909936 RepID=A0ABP8EIX1_9MICO|nr:tRNA glutamyl-Q(34) synthetase GluQRS [Brevibacterium daeguense]